MSAAFGPVLGRAIDRWGGRPVLLATNVFAAGLAALALACWLASLFAAWVVIGIAMGSGLYEAAFAALVRLYGRDSRSAITGITLIAGFASTVGWPLSTLMLGEFGWRGACWGWALAHLAAGLPLNASIPRAPPPASQEAAHHRPNSSSSAASSSAASSSAASSSAAPDHRLAGRRGAPQPAGRGRTPPSLVLIAFAFAVTWFISTAMAAHLPRLAPARLCAASPSFVSRRRAPPRWGTRGRVPRRRGPGGVGIGADGAGRVVTCWRCSVRTGTAPDRGS